MILDLLRREEVERFRVRTAAGLRRAAEAYEGGDRSAGEAHGIDAAAMRRAAEELEAASTGEEDGKLVYIPSSPILSALQAAVERAYVEAGLVAEPEVSGLSEEFVPVTTRRLPEQAVEVSGLEPFEHGDPGYAAGFALASAARIWRGRPQFVDRMAEATIGDQARVILLGDWGSGIERAGQVAKRVREKMEAGLETHVVHLGDVYFAGFAQEYEHRFLRDWPGEAGRSWAVAGNHDMYTGGHAFYDTLLADARFAKQAGTGWFLLENTDWQICGLDSAYALPWGTGSTGELAGTQAEKVTARRRAARGKGGVLLTHHQPFNVEGGTAVVHSPEMVQGLGPALDEGLVRAWFWGHEHDAAFYRPWRGVELPCLTGNAGVPEKHREVTPGGLLEWGWDGHIAVGSERYRTLGFTVLDFAGPELTVTMWDEFGAQMGPVKKVRAR